VSHGFQRTLVLVGRHAAPWNGVGEEEGMQGGVGSIVEEGPRVGEECRAHGRPQGRRSGGRGSW